MRRTTVALVAVVALLVVVSAAVLVLWRQPRPGADPARWPVEALAPDPGLALPYALHVTPAGCPGFGLSSPVPDDPRNVAGSGSFTLAVAPGHYALWVCMGPLEETNGARGLVAKRISTADDMTSMNATVVRGPSGDLVRVDSGFGPAAPPRLTDWVVDHGAYTYAFGYLHPDGDASRRAEVEAMIASVVWDQ